MKIFIDTGVFIAYFLKQEASHDNVVRKYKFYIQKQAQFATSNYILDELLTWFSSKQTKYFTEKLIIYLQRIIENGELKVVFIDNVIHKKAQDVLLKFLEHKISFTDATTYVLYKDFTLDEIFTLDSDFKRMRVNTSF